jgi:hypothetical protein
MRALSWQEIVAATTQDGNACVDGFEFAQHPYVSLKQKQFFQVPVLAGNCLNEGGAACLLISNQRRNVLGLRLQRTAQQHWL